MAASFMGGGPTYNVIGNGRFSSALQRFLGIRGSTPAPQLAPDVMGVYEISDYGAGRAFLLGVLRAEATGLVAAVAAQFSGFSIFNPVNSGVLLHINTLAISAANAVQVTLANVAGIAGAQQPRVTDGRWGAAVRPAAVVGASTEAVLPADAPQRTLFFAAAGTPVDYTLPPGWRIAVHVGTANVALTWAAQWDERKFNPEEAISG